MTKRGGRPARRRPPRRGLRALLFALGAIILTGTVALGGLLLVYPRQARGGEGRTFVLEIPAGVGATELAHQLAREGVIDSPWLFAVYLRVTRADEALRDGEVLLGDALRPDEVARRLRHDQDGIPVRVTIPEGWTRFDVARRLEQAGVCDAADFLAATSAPPSGVDAPSAEGYLFPDTYELRTGSDATSVAQRMFRNHCARTDALFEQHADALARLERELAMSRHDVIVLASVVEKEAAVHDERPVIAGVFLNRLRSQTFLPRQRLQADPTVSYGCLAVPEEAPSCASFDGRTITRAMLDDAANRYNTYRHPRLPPGPIANPGLSAIAAVLAPTEHDYLYFVARGGRRHTFSATLEGHNEAVGEYRARQP